MDKKKDSIELVGSTLLLIFTGIVGIVIWMLWGVLAGIVGVIMSFLIFMLILEMITKAFFPELELYKEEDSVELVVYYNKYFSSI